MPHSLASSHFGHSSSLTSGSISPLAELAARQAEIPSKGRRGFSPSLEVVSKGRRGFSPSRGGVKGDGDSPRRTVVSKGDEVLPVAHVVSKATGILPVAQLVSKATGILPVAQLVSVHILQYELTPISKLRPRVFLHVLCSQRAFPDIKGEFVPLKAEYRSPFHSQSPIWFLRASSETTCPRQPNHRVRFPTTEPESHGELTVRRR